MDWFQNFINGIKEFMESPTGTALVTIVTTLLSVLAIFAKTSIGRKSLKKIDNKSQEIAKLANESNEKVTNIEIESKERINALESDYSQKLNAVTSYVENLEALVYSFADVIPNKKIKELAENFKSQSLAIKDELYKFVGTREKFDAEVEQAVKEKTEEIRVSYETLIDDLRKEYDDRIKTLEEFVLRESCEIRFNDGPEPEMEEQYDGGEESVNTDSEEKEI